MKPNDTTSSKPDTGSHASSALRLAQKITGDTLIGVPPQTARKPTLPTTIPPVAAAAKPPAPAFESTHGANALPLSQRYTLPTVQPAPRTTCQPQPAADGHTSEPIPSSGAGIIRLVTLMVKLSIPAIIIGGICYFATTSLIPVVKELSTPTPTSAGVDKEATVFVQAIQQTRQIVAKNDANVARLDAILDDPANGGNTMPPAPSQQLAAGTPDANTGLVDPNQLPIPDSAFAPPAPVSVSIYSPGSPIEVNFTKLPGSSLSPELMQIMADRVTALEVNGIRNSTNPRVVIDGVLYKAGDMVDYQLEIAFTGIDLKKRMLVFETVDGDMLTRTY